MTPEAPAVSVAILNHRRPHLLARVLSGVAQLDYPNFEVIVVGDQPDLASYALPADLMRRISYDRVSDANICRSRNRAVHLAAGEIVAFIDDDAVPEPDWLAGIVRPFADPSLGAAGGLVRASDGLTIEWAGGVFDRAGSERPASFTDDIRVFDAASQIATGAFIGTLGANSAFRRAAVISVGGFDEAIRYYLDETELLLRLAEAGWSTALAQRAEVHHLREENQVRSPSRVPRDLHEVAASKAYFCQRHLSAEQIGPRLDLFRRNRLLELDPYIRLGYLGRRGRDTLMSQVEVGIAEGRARAPSLALSDEPSPRHFQPFRTDNGPEPMNIALISGWGLGHIRKIRDFAERLAKAGHRVSCFSFLTGARARSVDYINGVWLHRGGTWRFDHRADGRILIGRGARACAELERVAARRAFDLIVHPRGLRVGPGSAHRAFLIAGAPMETTLTSAGRVRPEGAIEQLFANHAAFSIAK